MALYSICWIQLFVQQGALLPAEHQQDTTPAGQEDNSNACSRLCNIAAGQWECLALWTPSNSAIHGATSPERSCSPCVSDWPTGAHNSSTERTTLVACPSSDFIQGASTDLSSTAWDCTSVRDRSTLVVPASKITTLQ